MSANWRAVGQEMRMDHWMVHGPLLGTLGCLRIAPLASLVLHYPGNRAGQLSDGSFRCSFAGAVNRSGV